jgi:energy-coupling factor transport system permease protein
VKIVATFALTVALFSVDGWSGLLVISGAVAAAIELSGVSWRLAVRGLRPVLWLLLFTLVVHTFSWQDPDALVHLGPVSISVPGLSSGAFLAVRIVVLMLGASLVTLTSSPVALTDALASMMRPLSVVRFPVEDVAMMFSIALRFIPTTAEEAERIVVAQTARGAVFDRGGPLARARAWIPVLIPLFVRLFRRADDLAVAMESRCYTGRERSRLRELVMRPADWATLVATVTLSLAVAILL